MGGNRSWWDASVTGKDVAECAWKVALGLGTACLKSSLMTAWCGLKAEFRLQRMLLSERRLVPYLMGTQRAA